MDITFSRVYKYTIYHIVHISNWFTANRTSVHYKKSAKLTFENGKAELRHKDRVTYICTSRAASSQLKSKRAYEEFLAP